MFERGRYEFRENRYEVALWPSCYENFALWSDRENSGRVARDRPVEFRKYKIKREAKASLFLILVF